MPYSIIFLQQSTPVAQTDTLDAIIAILIILLILSLITEKLTELIKKYIKIPDKVNRYKWLKNIDIDTEKQAALAKTKKKEVTLLAVMLGSLVALMAKASFFDLIGADNPREALFWGEGQSVEGSVLLFVLGIFFTGFFLSFGSAFFHDLLELLYYAKSMKRKLKKPETFSKNSLLATHEFIHTSDILLARRALDKHKTELKSKYKDLIAHLQIGATVNGQIGVIANLTGPKPIDFPDFFPADINGGQTANVAVECIVSEPAKIHAGVSWKLENQDNIGTAGALGAVVVSAHTDKKLLLTCSHVVTGGTSDDWGGFELGSNTGLPISILEHNHELAIGNLFYAKRDDKSDTALVAVDDIFDWDNMLPSGNHLLEARPLSEGKDLNRRVRFFSTQKNTEMEGVIHVVKSSHKEVVKYDDLTIHEYTGLIVIGNNGGGAWSTISEKGDSGSVIYDNQFRPIGLLIGGNNQFTFALPLSDLLTATNSKIFQSPIS
ncbi:MAG: hypothetical protein DWQ02_22025 [Bacteroidetes bacterium]|nr:MAG: hypothetical protein DWQ02_22025 [Bacteroidota bacterium]